VRREINPGFEIAAFFLAAVMPAEISLIPAGLSLLRVRPKRNSSKDYFVPYFLFRRESNKENFRNRNARRRKHRHVRCAISSSG
jgi:hypothetical protein